MSDNTALISQLEETKKELLTRVSQIDETINTIRGMSSFNQHNNGQSNNTVQAKKVDAGKYSWYNINATAKNKLASVLKHENKFLHIRQIAEIIHSIEQTGEVGDVVSKLYPAISQLKKAGSLVKISVGNSNVNSFWGSKNWINENGDIKPEHKYDESQLTNFEKEAIDI